MVSPCCSTYHLLISVGKSLEGSFGQSGSSIDCWVSFQNSVSCFAGDQVAHLLWRLIHGDIPVIHKPKLVVVMIGTNDLGAIDVCSSGNRSEIAHSAGGVIQRWDLAHKLDTQTAIQYTSNKMIFVIYTIVSYIAVLRTALDETLLLKGLCSWRLHRM